MEYERASSATFSKKLRNAHSFTSKSIYDGVFSASTTAKKLETSRAEDYSEIFYGSGSSIPVLDVPELNERKVSVDVRSSVLDYSKIFGGFGNAEFGVFHEELFANHNKGNAFSKEPWIPAETRSRPQESNPSNLLVENPILPHEASHQSFPGVKQFKMSYHKTNQGRKSGTNGTTHIAQLHDVPGYSCLVDELRATGDKPVSTALNDNLVGGIAGGNRKAIPDLPPNGASRQTSKGGIIYQNKINRSRSNSIDMLFDVCEIGLRTPPSGVLQPSSQLHNLSKNKGKSERSMASKFGFSKVHSSEGTASPGSPPYFDEEVDANSVAASSAAAVKKAIEEAQERIKIAKEIMERKKEGLQNRVKLNFNNGVKAEERRGDKIEDKANKFRKNKAREICEEVDTPMQVFGGMGKQNAVKAGQVAPNFRDGEKLLADEEAPGETHGQKSESAQADRRQEEAEEWEATKQGENEKKMMQPVTDYEWEEKNMAEKSVEKIEEYDNKLKAVEEAHKQEEVGRVLGALKGACELNECAKELESAPEVHDQEENDQELRVSRQQEETEEMLEAFYELEACEKKLKELPKPTENERKLETKEPDDDEILKRVEDDQERVENVKQWKEAHKQEENDSRLEGIPEREENETNLEEISGQKENGQRHEEACEGIEFEREQKEACRLEQEEACRLEQNEVEQKDVYSGEDSEKRSDKVQGQDVIEVVLNDFHDGEESEESFQDVIEDDELGGNEELIEAEENGIILKEVYQMKETVKRQRETCEWIETEIILSEIDQKAEDERMEVTQEALTYCGNNLEAANDAHGQGEFDNQSRTPEACRHEENNEVVLNDFHDGEESEESFQDVIEDDELGGNEELIEAEENGGILKEVYQMKETEKRQRETCEWMETEIILSETDQKAEDERMEVTQEALRYCGNNLEAANDAHGQGEFDNQSRTPEACRHEENNEVVLNDFHDGEESEESFQDVIEDDELGGNEELIEAEENGSILKEVYQMKETEKRQRETCEWIETEIILSETDQKAEDERMEVTREALRYCGNNLEAANDAHGQGEFENQSRTPEACRHEENNEGEEVTPEVHAHEANGGIMEVVEASFECKESGNELKAVEVANDLEETELFETSGLAQGSLERNEIKKQVKDTIEVLAFDKNKVHLGVPDMNLDQKQHNQHAKESKVVCNTGKHVEGLACEAEENNEDVKKAEVAIKQEKEENHFKPSHEERCVDHGKNMEAAQLPSMSEGKVEITEIAHEIKTSQSIEIVEENQHETLTMEEREAEDTLQKEVELEKVHLRKIDEAKERERETEMERLAVERAIREARERAFAEARERAERAAAERANAEARRRVIAEGRKPSAEANDKSSAEKSSMEAKLKAERAAVERATAEARERALEKALSEKAAFQARKQAEKFTAEKFHWASRDNGMRKNFSSYDSQNNNSGLSKSPRYPDSSDHGERFDGANGESAQRCKATVERDQRTAERAAKALAEKNMRDLLAQKEQSERDRLAEALDADIKRWSSGKEGNLRALLSSLQYILGPDSGWQPMPLADIITTTAVKKAYRKATLLVHPDKLQQRGASMQQKYTCEKVFDLLKDAWNKFSTAER